MTVQEQLYQEILKRGIVCNLTALCRELGIDYAWAFTCIGRLEAAGLISVLHRGRGSRRPIVLFANSRADDIHRYMLADEHLEDRLFREITRRGAITNLAAFSREIGKDLFSVKMALERLELAGLVSVQRRGRGYQLVIFPNPCVEISTSLHNFAGFTKNEALVSDVFAVSYGSREP